MSAPLPFDITAVEHAFLEFDLPAKPEPSAATVECNKGADTACAAEPRSESSAADSNGKALSMPELVAAITNVLSAKDYDPLKDIDRVRSLMESYDASSGDWRRFALVDESKHYTRNLVATDNKTFTLMMLCWTPHRGSPIHAHENANCWARVVDGVCRESRYAWPSDESAPLALTSVGDAGAGDVVFIRDDVGLHRIENPTDAPAVSLHLYSPPYDKCAVFLNPQQGRASNANVTFYSENGVKIQY